MSNDKKVNPLLASAAVLGGIFALVKLAQAGSKSFRENPKVSKHIKPASLFTDLEKDQVADRYSNGESFENLAKSFGTNRNHIRNILEERNVRIRTNKESTQLRLTTHVSEDTINQIKEAWDKQPKPTLKEMSSSLNLSENVIRRILIQHTDYERGQTQDIPPEDIDKLLKAKRDANAQGRPLPIYGIENRLGLTRQNLQLATVTRLFALHKLNRVEDYSGRLNDEQKTIILSYFNPMTGEQTKSIREISEEINSPKLNVALFLYYNNIVPEAASTHLDKPLTDEDKSLITELFDQNMNNSRIVRETGISRHKVAAFINELRASRGRTSSRRSESINLAKPQLLTQEPSVIEYIIQARSKPIPDHFKDIAEHLNKTIPLKKGFEAFSISLQSAARIYREHSESPTSPRGPSKAHPAVIDFIKAARSKAKPESFQKITEELISHMKGLGFSTFSIHINSVRGIYKKHSAGK